MWRRFACRLANFVTAGLFLVIRLSESSISVLVVDVIALTAHGIAVAFIVVALLATLRYVCRGSCTLARHSPYPTNDALTQHVRLALLRCAATEAPHCV